MPNNARVPHVERGGRGLLVLACLLLGACMRVSGVTPHGPTASDGVAAAAEQPLAPGDALRLSFSAEPQFNGEYAIDETGTAALPLLGARVVTGSPAPRIKQDLVAEYAERTRNEDVQVVYLRRVRVLGQVRNPGLYRVDPTMSFGDAVALAGGAADDGDLEKVSLFRDGTEVAEGLDVREQLAVHSGDQIYVPKTRWLSRYGSVLVGATISAMATIIAFSLR